MSSKLVSFFDTSLLDGSRQLRTLSWGYPEVQVRAVDVNALGSLKNGAITFVDL